MLYHLTELIQNLHELYLVFLIYGGSGKYVIVVNKLANYNYMIQEKLLHTHTPIRTRTHALAHVHIHAQAQTHIHTHAHTHSHTNMYIQKHAHTHAPAHTNMHRHAHTRTSPCPLHEPKETCQAARDRLGQYSSWAPPLG